MGKKKPTNLDKASKEQLSKFNKTIDEEIDSIYKNKDLVLVELKKNNRWVLDLPEELNISRYIVKNVNRPSFPFNVNKLVYITLYDTISPSISKLLIEFLDKQKPFDFSVKIVDPIGKIVETWEFRDCFINSVVWSGLDYSDDEPSTLSLEINFNKINII